MLTKNVRTECKTLCVLAMLVVSLPSARAITTVAGINFQDNAFADTVISSSGSYTLVGAGTLASAVTGSGVNKFAYSSSAGAYIQLGFADNYLVNGTGYDLALFEYGSASTFSLTIGGITHTYLSAGTGFTSVINGTTYQINVAEINLDDFSVAVGTQLSSITVGMDNSANGVPTLGVAGALNSALISGQSVPDAGASISLLGLAILGLGIFKRKI